VKKSSKQEGLDYGGELTWKIQPMPQQPAMQP